MELEQTGRVTNPAIKRNCGRGYRAKRASKLRFPMRYRVYSGPTGSADLGPLEKHHLLFKEFGDLDEALSWSQHVEKMGRIALLIEGDDGTRMNKRAIAEALRVGARERVSA
jgi:hypothetical protein